MTDAEIIKGLVCCYVINTACDNCAYRKTEDCNETLVIDALSLIKRQQAEITHLETKNFVKTDMINCLQEKFENAKVEVVKELAEKLKELYETDGIITDDMKVPIEVIRANIDDIVEEMIGTNNDR